ncbi:MAG: TonB-dependent receptor [Desulfobulbaceae bacterium]|nr:TonB-dependent receptor [Desulfobulbaceae bacterium]
MNSNHITTLAPVIALFLASQAMAAPADEANLYTMSLDELMEVEVGIASKQPETVRDAPSAVTVFTRNEIQAMGIDNVYDLLNYVPGFQSTRLIDIVQQSLIHSRGLANLNGAVLFMMNGHRLNENSLGTATRFTRVLSTANVRQVEIIRGPGSALYGSNAFLGVVNIITLSGENNADLHAGANDAVGGYANISKTLGAISLDASLSYDDDRGEEYDKGQDFPQGPSSTRDPSQDLNFTSTLALNNTKLEIAYMKHEDQDFLSFNGVAPAGTAWSESTYIMTSLSHNWKLSDAISVKGAVSFSRHELSSVGWFGAANPAATPPYLEDRLLGPYSQNSSYESSLDMTWRINSTNDLLSGISYRHEGADTLGHYTNYWNPQPGKEVQPNQAFYLGGAERIEDVASLDSRERFLDNYGVYTQYRRDLTDTLHATAGLRFDQYDTTGTTTNPRLGLIWEASNDLTLKAFWGTAFRSPSLAELYTDSQRSMGNIDLQPERIETTELIGQKRFRSTELEMVYFHNHLTDVIERSIVAAAPFNGRQTWDNGDDQSYDGLETRVIWDLFTALRLTLSHTHIFSGLEANTYDDFSSFIVDYHPGRWQLNINGIYRDQQDNGLESQNDYVVTNAKLSYALNKTVTLYSRADNLFDYRYQTAESDISSTYFNAVPNQRMRWILGMEAEW